MLSLPDVMQATDYTCGPASVLSYVTYYQPDNEVRELEIAKMAKTDEDYGTSPYDLADALQKLLFPNYTVSIWERMSI